MFATELPVEMLLYLVYELPFGTLVCIAEIDALSGLLSPMMVFTEGLGFLTLNALDRFLGCGPFLLVHGFGILFHFLLEW